MSEWKTCEAMAVNLNINFSMNIYNTKTTYPVTVGMGGCARVCVCSESLHR